MVALSATEKFSSDNHKGHPKQLHCFFSSEPSIQFESIPSLLRCLPLSNNSRPILPPPVPHPNPQRKVKPTYAITLSYNGIAFPGGYQYNSVLDNPTVQGTLSQRLSSVLGAKVPRIASAGRTDARVSAKAALCTFVTHTPLPPRFLEQINALNTKHHDDIYVHGVERVHSSFHATFGTTAREYLYVLPLRPSEEQKEGVDMIASREDRRGRMMMKDYAHRVGRIADIMLSQVVNEEINYVGMSHGKVTTQTTLCTVHNAGCWYYDGSGRYSSSDRHSGEEVVLGFGDCWRDTCVNTNKNCGCLVFKVKADRFLRRMMRKLVNSVLEEASFVCLTNKEENEMHTVDQWKGRWRERVERKIRSGNLSAPPEGLCLWRVEVL